MKKIVTILVILAVTGLIGFRLVSNKKEINSKNQVKDVSDFKVSVNTARAEIRTGGKNLRLLGTVNAHQEIQIKSEVQGKLENLNFQLGDFVKTGAHLARVDDRLRQLALANAEQGLADAKQNFGRYSNLLKGGAATQAQYDQYKLAYENAKIQADQARKELSNTAVKAPFSGYITEKHVEAGTFVSIGNPIATIIDVSKLKVKVNVPEKDVYALKKGDKVSITSSVYPGVEFSGNITFIGFKGDESHNYPVEISITNQDKNPLKAGTYVNISFNRENPMSSLQIPREAISGSIRSGTVYVVDDNNIARVRQITAGTEHDNWVEVIEGLKEGDQVVTSGQINLKDGTLVEVVN